jgi:hypothetical protein
MAVEHGQHGRQADFNADVYVFCAHTAQTHDEYDPLDLRHWRVAVLATRELRRIVQKSMSWAKVVATAGSESSWATLNDDVLNAFGSVGNTTRT